MRRPGIQVAMYTIVILLGVVFIGFSQIPAFEEGKDLLLNLGCSVTASAIISFLILFFVGDPFEKIERSLSSAADEFKLSLQESIDVLALSTKSGLIGVWSSRSDLEIKAWVDRLDNAKREVFILAFAMEFLSEHERFIKLLRDRGRQGCRVRLIMGDPFGSAVVERNREERLEGSIRSRVETTLIRLTQITDGQYVTLKLHNSPLYCALYGFDDEIIVTPHLYGLRGAAAPTLLVRDNGDGLYQKYKKHFEDTWDISRLLQV